MKSSLRVVLVFAAVVASTAATHGQAVLSKTTLGAPQNDGRDLANSLVPGEKKYGGKGEKKEQVNASELKSKSVKDTTFGGSLLNMGIDPAAPKLDESKLHEIKSEKDSTASRQAGPNEKEPLLKLDDPALAAYESNQSDAGVAAKESKTSSAAGSDTTGSDPQKKDQKPASGSTEEKPATNSTDKSSPTKPDRDH